MEDQFLNIKEIIQSLSKQQESMNKLKNNNQNIQKSAEING